MNEHFKHDVCPVDGSPSIPAEGVPDQALRGCRKCGHVWFEDLDSPPTDHVHRFGRVERAHFTGNPHRRCVVAGCSLITLDLEDDDGDD